MPPTDAAVETDFTCLDTLRLTVDNGAIRLESPQAARLLGQALDILSGAVPAGAGMTPSGAGLTLLAQVLSGLRAGAPAPLAGLLHKRSHKSHKRSHKRAHKGLHKRASLEQGEVPAATDFDWPEIDTPWKEVGLLHRLRDHFRWDRLPLDPPPPEAERLAEVREVLLPLQARLRGPEEALRRQRIVAEAGNDLTAYMQPLGADVVSPGSATAMMFQTVVWLGGLIGQHYKARFMAPRPGVLEPALSPFLPVPAHSSYPSNHAFQSFLIAELFARTVPEHPGIPALFRAAREVAENREWAGLHIPSDTAAGIRLARLAMPVMEAVMAGQMADVRAEWL